MPASYELTEGPSSATAGAHRTPYQQPVHERVSARLVYTEDELRLAHADALARGTRATVTLGADIYLERGCMTLSSPGFTIEGNRHTIRVGLKASCLFLLAADNLTIRNLDIDTDLAAASDFVILSCTSLVSWLRLSHIRIKTSTVTQRARKLLQTSGSGSLFSPRVDDVMFDTGETDWGDVLLDVVSNKGVYTRLYGEGQSLDGSVTLQAGSDSNIFGHNALGGSIDTSAATNSVIDGNVIEGSTTSDATDTVGDND